MIKNNLSIELDTKYVLIKYRRYIIWCILSALSLGYIFADLLLIAIRWLS